VVIVFAPDIVMEKGECFFILLEDKGLLVKALFEYGFYIFICISLDMQCPGAGLFQTFWGVAFY
jgi:hypothetical protein